MTDNTRVNEIQDKFLQAMDILNAKALSSLSYDKTIECTVENDLYKEEGKYEVSDGLTIFTAYSENTSYRKDDVVYVTIPQGNYENQKMIVSKKTSDNKIPFNFVKPFDSLFSMTGNLFAEYQNERSLVANGSTVSIEIGTISNLELIKFTRLGIKADFQSWVKNAIKGSYGINIEVTMEQGTSYYQLDNTRMFGNPYNFETYYTQEVVLDIENQDMGKITKISVSFQQENDFEDQFGEKIPDSETNENGETVSLPPNLFIKNIEVHLGYDMSIFTKDFVEIYTGNSDGYQRSVATDKEVAEKEIQANDKNINMRWVHLDAGKPVDMVGMEQQSENTNSQYEIRWYRYHLGAAAADQYSGIYWKRLYVSEPTEDDPNYRFRYPLKDEKTYGNTKQFTNLIFSPDVNWQEEHIKAIIIHNDTNIYSSNELVFKNAEDLPPSEEAQHIMNALNIECDDHTNGNYLVYGQDNSIKDTKYAKEVRTLSAYFDVNSDGTIELNKEKITNIEELTWKFPTSNTMIELLNGGIYEKIDLLSSPKGLWTKQINNEGIISYVEVTTDDIDINEEYYKLENGEYVKVTNLYKKGMFYTDEYKQCNEDLQYDPKQIYYTKNNQEETYTKVINMSLGQYETDPTKYYILTYVLSFEDRIIEGETYYQFNNANGIVQGVLPQYKISSYYSASKTNNTVTCEYELNGVVYVSEKEFTFGPAGTMGSDKTLVIDFVGDKNSVIADQDKVVQFELRVYDKQNIQQQVPEGSVTWKWYYYHNGEEKKTLNITAKNATYIYDGEEFKIQGLYILQASIGNLTTYFPIPVSNGQYSYIKGATQVIYQSNGEPVFNREEYGLYTKDNKLVENKENEIKWLECILETVLQYTKLGKITKQQFNTYGKNNLYIYNANTGKYDQQSNKTYNSSNIYYLGENKPRMYSGKVVNNALQPLSIYIEDAPVYGVQAIKDNNILWTQPILVLQNRWPSNVINSWDGEKLVLNEDNGTILTAAISAGKKNSDDNTFSGVMLGDWSKTDTNPELTRQTGIYGFHHGAMSYAFKDDGTGFIGKSGQGQINFNGNKATIYSAGWNSNGSVKGMEIDLDQPHIKLSSGQKVTDENYITTYPNNIILNVSLEKNPFQIGTKFFVDWDGTLDAKAGSFTGTIEANNGTIGGWTIDGNSLVSSENNVQLQSNGTIFGAKLKTNELALQFSNSNEYIYVQKYLLSEGKWVSLDRIIMPASKKDRFDGEGEEYGNVKYQYEEGEDVESQADDLKSTIGVVSGNDGNVEYYAVGMKTAKDIPLIFESSKNIRLTAGYTGHQGVFSGDIYLQGNELFWNNQKVDLTGNTTAVFG